MLFIRENANMPKRRKIKFFITLLILLITIVVLVVFIKSDCDDQILLDENQVIVKLTSPPEVNSSDFNIILISIDTLRADHMSCYGYSRSTTPNIDKLAKESIFFENAYSQAPSTVPALRAIMTGGVNSQEDKNAIISYYSNATFLAEILQGQKYKTAAFTDHYALGNKNEEHSFNVYHAHTLTQGFDSFENYGKDVKGVTSHFVTKNAISWLENNNKDKFFLWLHYFDPHFDYNPLAEYAELFGFPKEGCGRIYLGLEHKKMVKIQDDLTQHELDCIIRLYDAEIFYTDIFKFLI